MRECKNCPFNDIQKTGVPSCMLPHCPYSRTAIEAAKWKPAVKWVESRAK